MLDLVSWALRLLNSSASALKGSLLSLTVVLCWSFDIPAFEKQYMIFSLATLFQARTSIFMASKTLNDGISLFSRAVTMHVTDTTLYFDLNDQITSWSIGCVWEVVFGGRNTISIAFRSLTSGCAGQLSTISAVFLLSHWNLQSSLQTHSSKRSEFIQAFFGGTISTGLVLDYSGTGRI